MRVSALITQNHQILLIHRFTQGKEYYVLPGGGTEKGENIETAAIREIKEETNLDAIINKKLCEYKNNFDNRIHHIFLVTKFSGYIKLSGPEAIRNSESNKYILEWHRCDRVPDLLMCPQSIQEIIKYL